MLLDERIHVAMTAGHVMQVVDKFNPGEVTQIVTFESRDGSKFAAVMRPSERRSADEPTLACITLLTEKMLQSNIKSGKWDVPLNRPFTALALVKLPAAPTKAPAPVPAAAPALEPAAAPPSPPPEDDELAAAALAYVVAGRRLTKATAAVNAARAALDAAIAEQQNASKADAIATARLNDLRRSTQEAP